VEGDDPPVRVIRKKREPASSADWMQIDTYPCLDAYIRGARVYRTKDPFPLRYRVVLHFFDRGKWRIPAEIAIANERRIRFDDAPVEFGFLLPPESKVSEWVKAEDLPDFRNADVIISNPDYVEYRA
jgi:hypothetical protein